MKCTQRVDPYGTLSYDWADIPSLSLLVPVVRPHRIRKMGAAGEQGTGRLPPQRGEVKR